MDPLTEVERENLRAEAAELELRAQSRLISEDYRHQLQRLGARLRHAAGPDQPDNT